MTDKSSLETNLKLEEKSSWRAVSNRKLESHLLLHAVEEHPGSNEQTASTATHCAKGIDLHKLHVP